MQKYCAASGLNPKKYEEMRKVRGGHVSFARFTFVWFGGKNIDYLFVYSFIIPNGE